MKNGKNRVFYAILVVIVLVALAAVFFLIR